MSDLRETIKAMDSGYVDDLGLLPEAFTVLERFADGRLVDRKAIDYEAAADYAQEFGVNPRDPEQLVGLFDAAFGDTDEPMPSQARPDWITTVESANE